MEDRLEDKSGTGDWSLVHNPASNIWASHWVYIEWGEGFLVLHMKPCKRRVLIRGNWSHVEARWYKGSQLAGQMAMLLLHAPTVKPLITDPPKLDNLCTADRSLAPDCFYDKLIHFEPPRSGHLRSQLRTADTTEPQMYLSQYKITSKSRQWNYTHQ